VSRTKQWLLGTALVAGLALLIGAVALWRVREAEDMSRPHAVHTYGGTNYVVSLKELTVGRSDAGYVLLVAVLLQNTNNFPVALNRNAFILVDANKDYYLPSTTGTQTPVITVPAAGTVDSEVLSFSVPEEGLNGAMGMQIGQNFWIMLREDKPFELKLKSGEFVTFRRRDW
jgi:hypothetical protein